MKRLLLFLFWCVATLALPVYGQQGITVQVCSPGACPQSAVTISIQSGTVVPIPGAPAVTVSNGSSPVASSPTFSPAAGSYSSPQTVTLSTSTPLGIIHYTSDGSTPSCSSPTYLLPLTVSSTATINAISCALVYTPSSVSSATYTITGMTPLPLVLPAIFFPQNGATATHPYNTTATQFPDETRCFTYSGGCTPIMQTVDTTQAPFGYNYLRIDPTMPYVVVDSGMNPNILTTLHVVSPYGDPPYNVPNVPIVGARVENGLYQCPANPPYDAPDGKDHHALIYDVRTKLLWEEYQVCTTTGDATGTYYTETSSTPNASSVGWDVTKFNTRPLGQDSIEAAGREVLPWTLRWSEISAGPVNHAIRFTPPTTHGASTEGSAVTPPAVHGAGNSGGSPFYEGQRFRFDCSKHATNDGTDICSSTYQANLTVEQIRFITTLTTYGIVVADNAGGGYYMTFDDDPNWANFSFLPLHIRMMDFVPVNSGLITDLNGNVLTQ